MSMYNNADEEPFDRSVEGRGQQAQEDGPRNGECLQQNVQIEKGEYDIGHVFVHILHENLHDQ